MMAATRIDLLRKLVRAWIREQLDTKQHLAARWRHHGIGCLQAYIDEGGLTELRVHVWDASLKTVPDFRGDIHDHRFDFTSHVLAGTVINEVWSGWLGFEFDLYEVEHFRAAAAPARPAVRKMETRCHFGVLRDVYDAGASYEVRRGEFHRTIVAPSPFAVTLIEKRNQRDDVKARLLCKTGEELVHAFPEGRPAPNYEAILREAVYELGQ